MSALAGALDLRRSTRRLCGEARSHRGGVKEMDMHDS